MTGTAAVWLVLICAAVAANLPFVNERLFFAGPLRNPKSLPWRLVELAVLFALTLSLGMALETRIGQRHSQGWQFYVASACLFLTLAFPGFTWRYLRRHH